MRVSAVAATEAALARIADGDGRLNAFTAVTAERALAEAAAVDAARASGADLPPLAGVPYAVKNLFDLDRRGHRRRLEDRARAARRRRPTPILVERLRAAGAVCVGALNMDEYAYGFTTENAHDGPCHNPHDLSRSAGGSSGGCGAAVAGGLVPLSLGSDTNGSIRVPASLCGIFGLKPTYGRLARTGSYPFVASLDHLGPFARTVADLAAAWDALQGDDPADPAQWPWPVEPATPVLGQGIDGLRIAVADDYFARNGHARGVRRRGRPWPTALGVERRVTMPEAARAPRRGLPHHRRRGRQPASARPATRPQDFDPGTRDRFLAGSLIPAPGSSRRSACGPGSARGCWSCSARST